MRHLITLAAAAAFSLATLAGAGPAEAKRVALLIGNAAYDHTGALRNPVNDAGAMEARLQALGFEIERVDNAGRLDMARAIKRFGQKSRAAEIALVFYSGHGMEVSGRNYLIPIDAELQREDDADLEAIPLESATAAAGGASELSVVIVDACRNNQFPSSSRSGAKGFAAVGARPGQVIAFSTAPGRVAYDGDRGLSPFTQALTEALATSPSEDVRILMTTLGAATERYAGAEQRPFTRIGDMPPGKRVTLAGVTDLGASPPTSEPIDTGTAAPEDDVAAEAPGAEPAAASEPEAAPEPDPIPSEVVWEAQRLLKSIGRYQGTVDGDWGPKSVNAYNAFAAQQGLVADGRPNAASLALMRVLAEQAEAERAARAEERARAEAAAQAAAAREAEAEAARLAERRAAEAERRAAEEARRREEEARRRAGVLPDGAYRGRSGNVRMGIVYRGGQPTTGSITVAVNGRDAVTPMRFKISPDGWISGVATAPHPQVRVLDLAGRMPEITVKLLVNGAQVRETVRFRTPR